MKFDPGMNFASKGRGANATLKGRGLRESNRDAMLEHLWRA